MTRFFGLSQVAVLPIHESFALSNVRQCRYMLAERRSRGLFFIHATTLLLASMQPSNSHAGESHSELFPNLKNVKGLVLPIGQDSSQPTIRLECAEIRTERKAVGFLKVGLIPQVVAEGLRLRIENSPQPSVWARELSDFLADQPALASAVLKRFEILFKTPDASISSSYAQFRKSPLRIELHDVQVSSPMVRDLRSAKATIHLEEAKAGYLLLTDGDYRPIKITHDSPVFSP